MKKLISLILFVFSCVSIYCADGVIVGDKVITQESEKLMFVLFAKDGRVEIDQLNNNRGNLILHGVHPHMTYFTNRPYKKAGQTNSELLNSG